MTDDVPVSMGWRESRIAAIREINLSPTVVKPLVSNSSDIDNNDDETSSTAGLVEGGTSPGLDPKEARPRETISFDVNIIFDRLFDESQIKLPARQRGPEMVERILFAEDVDRNTYAECEQTGSENDKNAKLLLSLNSELVSGNVESEKSPKVSKIQRPIWGASINPTLVKAIQEDFAHVLSEQCVSGKSTNKVRPYHVTVAYLTKLPSLESVAAPCASDGPRLQGEAVEKREQQEPLA